MEAYVDGRAGAEEAEAVEEHVLLCAACAGELADLARFRGALTALNPSAGAGAPAFAPRTAASPTPTSAAQGASANAGAGFWRRLFPDGLSLPALTPVGRVAFAAGLVGVFALGALGGTALVVARAGREREAVARRLAAVSAEADAAARERDALKAERGALLAAAVRSENRRTAEARGREARLASLAAENRRLQAALADAESREALRAAATRPDPAAVPSSPLPSSPSTLAAGGLPDIPDLSRLRPTTVAVRGGEPVGGGDGNGPALPGPDFTVSAPAGTRVLTDRPVFSWRMYPGAAYYAVFVSDAADNPVAQSVGRVPGTSWGLPPKAAPLPRGRVLVWEVHAYDDTGRELAFSGEGRFEVVTEREAAAVRAGATRAAGPVGRAAVYAGAGLLDDAQAALSRPGATGTAADRLRAAVRAARPSAAPEE
jgi:hypothetical protein